jgi:REP element-mobilizing transposase RayT
MPQSLANILIHVVWSTKERRPLISDAVRAGLHGYMAGILKNLESPALIVNSVTDHVHVLCQLSKNMAACKLIEEVKKSSANGSRTRAFPILRGKTDTACFQSANQTRTPCGNTSKTNPIIIASAISKTSSASFVGSTMCHWTNVMCGIDFVTPFQGLNFCYRETQGVALGCPVIALSTREKV